MSILKILFLSAALLFGVVVLSGCTRTLAIPPQLIPEVSHSKTSAPAIDISLKPPLSLFGSPQPDEIYFARIDDGGGLLQQQVVRSNYVKDGRAYLLNARPGTYVAVAEFHQVRPRSPATGSPSKFTTYFSKELVEATKVTVREGAFVFAGRYVVALSMGLRGADEVQSHYNNIVAPDLKGFGIPDARYRGTLLEGKNDEQTYNEFVRKAKEDLAGSGWSTRIR